MGAYGYGYSPFLTSALFFGVGMHSGGYHSGGYHRSHRDSWSSEEDQQWRASTQAPYFENKVPGSENYLSAAAVVGKVIFQAANESKNLSLYSRCRNCLRSVVVAPPECSS